MRRLGIALALFGLLAFPAAASAHPPQARGTMSRYVVDRPGLAKPILERKS